MRLLVLFTRTIGLCPVYRESVSSRVPLTPTSPPGDDEVPRTNGLPQYKPSLAWTAYSCLLFLALMVIDGFLCFEGLRALRDPDIATGLINVMSAVAYAASFLSAVAMVAGAVRKYRLLPRLLNWPVCPGAIAHPTPKTLLYFFGPYAVAYVYTDYGFVMREPSTAILLLVVITGLLERFNLMFLAGRARLCFAAVNEELRQLGSLFRDRMRLHYVPDAAAKIAQLRVQHAGIATYAELLNTAYELQIAGILLYDFGTTVLTSYQFIVFLSRGDQPTDERQEATVLFFNTMYSAVSTVSLCQACYWMHRLGMQTHALVHKALSNIAISEEESLQLTIFSMQLMHQKFNMSPLGIFILDNSLLASLSLGVVMYVLVLFQFGSPATGPVPTTPTPLNSTLDSTLDPTF
ncbi:Gustatory receptor 100 [Frankliniella occidentalis]|nr:Gustatory receptor 100 [Frankliniella occidentalis]